MPVLRSVLLVLVLAVACAAPDAAPRRAPDTAAPAAASAPAIVDDFGDTLRLTSAPARIVSLNPATTEILFALGAGDRVVGRSRWDEWPAAARRVPAVGDGIRPNVEAVLAARPQLVVLYAGADNREAARRLRAAGVPTLSIKADRLADFRRVTRLLGVATGRVDAARLTVDTVDATLARVRRLTSGRPRPTVLWRAWDTPLLVIGGGSYFTELLDVAGGRNVFDDLPQPSPQVAFEEVLRRDPDVVVGGVEEVAKLRADPRWSALRAVRAGRVLVVDDDVFSRQSVRIGEAAVRLAAGLHPELAGSLRAPR